MSTVDGNPELFIGLVGPIGVDLEAVEAALTRELKHVNYETVPIRITEIMKASPTGVKINTSTYAERYHSLIEYADKVCELANNSAALAGLAIARIREERERITKHPDKPARNVAYIIRQFKRPDEIDLMRKTYGRKFVQISVTASEQERKAKIIENIKSSDQQKREDIDCTKEAMDLMRKDYDEGEAAFGQRISKIFHLGDVFVYGLNKLKIEQTIRRFVEALFGHNGISPTKLEYGMYMAAAASLRSIDLSRQVGASIFSSYGEVISMGCNEVPKAFGGTYWAEDGENARRDFEKGADANHSRKLQILSDLLVRMGENNMLSDDLKAKGNVLDQLRYIIENEDIKESQVMDIIEFGRMIHAEMSAITDAARTGISVRGAVMYCTTFPCHMCAKHIVSSGIKTLVYLEPYPKSYAVELNSDSITFDEDLSDRKVLFTPFVGISPRRYRDIFEKKGRKSSNGKKRDWYFGEPQPMIEDRTANYVENEDSSIAYAVPPPSR